MRIWQTVITLIGDFSSSHFIRLSLLSAECSRRPVCPASGSFTGSLLPAARKIVVMLRFSYEVDTSPAAAVTVTAAARWTRWRLRSGSSRTSWRRSCTSTMPV